MRMRLKTLRGLSVSLTMLNVLAAGAAILPMVPATQAERRVAVVDDSGRSLRDYALEAGSRAAVLAYCGIDSAPIEFAFVRELEVSEISQTAKADLWQSYERARSSAVAVLARNGMSQCEGAYGLLKDTLHDLNGPVSLGDSDNADPELDYREPRELVAVRRPKPNPIGILVVASFLALENQGHSVVHD
jgi:hypothetical protein